jgi:threonine dehydratase
VASYALELLRAVPDLDVAYVPIGLGSGICGMIAARDALKLKTEIVGVVSELAPAYALSFEQKRAVEHPVSTRIADGMACRTPEPEALEILWYGMARVVRVSDDEIEEAMRLMFSATHNVAEGAGAAGLAAATRERERLAGLKAAVILCGANVDRDVFARILGGK